MCMMTLRSFVVVMIMMGKGVVSGEWRLPRGDDADPNTAVIQALASRLQAVEADLASQKQQVTLLKNELNRRASFSIQFAEQAAISVPDGGILPFDHPILNIDNVYNVNTHAFTAPYDGDYWFYARVDIKDFRSFEIRRNGHGINRCDNDGGMRAVTCGVVTSLKAGDTVTVNHKKFGTTGGVIDPGPESLFTGFLIR